MILLLPAFAAPDLDQLQAIHAESTLPGFAVAVVDRDGVQFSGAFGDVTTGNSQIVASVSKTFLGVALLAAQQQGHLDLDQPAEELLGFPLRNPRHPDHPVTLRHLATHTSSLKSQIPDVDKIIFSRDPLTPDPGFSRRERKAIKASLAYETLPLGVDLEGRVPAGRSKSWFAERPGERYRYSNLGAALAAYALERAVGEELEVYLRSTVFDPLDMNQSSFRPTQLSNRAIHHTGPSAIPLPVYTHRFPAVGGLSSSVLDLSAFLTEMIRGHEGSGTLLTQESYQELFTTHFASDPPIGIEGDLVDHGVFWTHIDGGEIGHTGGGLGASAFMFFDPQSHQGRVFITNCELTQRQEWVTGFLQVWSALE